MRKKIVKSEKRLKVGNTDSSSLVLMLPYKMHNKFPSIWINEVFYWKRSANNFTQIVWNRIDALNFSVAKSTYSFFSGFFSYFYLHDVLCMYYYLYSLLLSSLEALSLSCDCEKGFRVKLEWLSSCVLSPTYQAKCGLGDPSSDEQVRLRPWPSRRVWFWGRPLISGGLGGPANRSKQISDSNLQEKWLDFTWNQHHFESAYFFLSPACVRRRLPLLHY